MTNSQKQRIELLRSQGKSYALIAKAMGLPVNTIKSHCRRKGLGDDSITNLTPIKEVVTCAYCGCSLSQMPGKKKRRFCSDQCRMIWWANHPETVNRKAVYRFTCLICKKEFESYGNATRKYCSRTCYGQSRRTNHDEK